MAIVDKISFNADWSSFFDFGTDPVAGFTKKTRMSSVTKSNVSGTN